MSENMAYSHFTLPDGARIGYVGPPNPGVECRIDPDTNEILVKSPAQMMGYYKQPEITAECYTPDGFFKTGDMGEVDEEGRLRITGRVKELFKTSKGKYVAPVPIENQLGAHPKIEVVCVCGADQPSTYCLVVPSEDARQGLSDPSARETLEQELVAQMERVNADLDPHERLGFAVVLSDPWTIESGLLTPTMKIRRNAIEARYADRVEGWFGAKRPVVWDS